MRKLPSVSDSVRRHASEAYVRPAQNKGGRTFSINVGEVHRAVALRNRVPLVCQALESGKFLKANRLRLISKIGPASGQSTTVTYTYEFVDEKSTSFKDESWERLRGTLTHVFSQLGGGEKYLRNERENFYSSGQSR